MSYEEVQFEEKSVQLIPEDLEILSEYSWDMAGYTPRFGFFYQGNENADIDGLTKWQAEHIFQLTPMIPPNGVCIYTSQNAKIPTIDPTVRRGKIVGILGVAFIGTVEIHASLTATTIRMQNTCIL